MQAALLVSETDRSATSASQADVHLDLMARVAQKKDREAFHALFVHFAPRIKGLMIKSGADAEQAEDIAQTVMMSVWNKVHQFSPERGSVSAWIFTIARNARVDRLRRGSSQPYLDIDDLEIMSDDPDGEDITHERQRAEKVAQAMTELPQDQRRIIELAFVEDISQSEISKLLDIPLGTVKSRMRLAYAKLRDRLEDLQ